MWTCRKHIFGMTGKKYHKKQICWYWLIVLPFYSEGIPSLVYVPELFFVWHRQQNLLNRKLFFYHIHMLCFSYILLALGILGNFQVLMFSHLPRLALINSKHVFRWSIVTVCSLQAPIASVERMQARSLTFKIHVATTTITDVWSSSVSLKQSSGVILQRVAFKFLTVPRNICAIK